MYKLLLLAIIFVMTFTSCVIPTYTGKSTLKETEVSKSDVKISSVLIAGAGSTASRLFLENLSTELIKHFAQYQIQCDFTYVGKIPRRSYLNLNKVLSSKYNGYLVLNPMDTSYADTHKSVAVVGTPLPGGYGATGSVIGNQYKEDYYAELYINGNSLNKVWQGELKVDFDFATPTRYQKIAKQIFDKLLKNGFISKR